MKNQKLVERLNQLLSNYFVMYVKLHRYHWFIQGHHFFTLHEKFEEMYNMFANEIDVIAERILMIEGKPLATMIKYLKEATIEEATADDKESEIISQLIDNFGQLIDEIQQAITLANEQEDEPTIDMLIHFQGELEKYVWMLNAYQAYK